MRKKIYSSILIAISFFVAISLSLSSCSKDDSSDPDGSALNVEVSEIMSKTAVVSWNLVSDKAINHGITVVNKETGEECFEGATADDYMADTIITTITVKDLSPETEYEVTVIAIDEDYKDLGEGTATFTTIETPPLPTIENITIEEGLTGGFNISWDKQDGASGYFIIVAGEQLNDIQSQIPYKIKEEPAVNDTIRINAWSQLKDEVIATGFIIYE